MIIVPITKQAKQQEWNINRFGSGWCKPTHEWATRD